MPPIPSLAASRITSTGKCFSSSHRIACGAIFSAAKSRAMSRTAIWSSLRANCIISSPPLGKRDNEFGEMGTFNRGKEFLVCGQHPRVPPTRGLEIDEIVNWMHVAARVLQRRLDQILYINQPSEELRQSSCVFRGFEWSDQFLHRFAGQSVSDLGHD